MILPGNWARVYGDPDGVVLIGSKIFASAPSEIALAHRSRGDRENCLYSREARRKPSQSTLQTGLILSVIEFCQLRLDRLTNRRTGQYLNEGNGVPTGLKNCRASMAELRGNSKAPPRQALVPGLSTTSTTALVLRP